MKTVKLKIDGMHCASCVNRVEKNLNALEGVDEATVNIANDSAQVSFDEQKIGEQDLLDAVKDSGYEGKLDQPEMTSMNARVEGMTCAACVNRVDKALNALDGVKDVSVNIANDKASLKYDQSQVRLSEIKAAVKNAGYELVMEEQADDEVDQDELKMMKAKKRMLIAAAITSVMMLMMVVHMFIVNIPGYTIMVAVMGLPVVFYLGRHVHKASINSIKNLSPNMDVLVSMGSVPPYVIGLTGLFLPITTFMEMAMTIMTFHLIGKYLETRAKGKASQAIKKLMELGAKTARVIIDGEEVNLPVNELSPGDIMLVKPGEKLPSDGDIIEGESTIDESIATGESMPVKRKVGDAVIGATLNKEGVLKVKVTKTREDTFLSQVIKLVEACQGSKVPIQAFADKVTGYFVPVVLMLTIVTFTSFLVFTGFHVNIMTRFEDVLPWINTDQSALTLAFITATAVLVIACPCALGLGTPTALMVGSGKGAENGILIRHGEAVQTLKDIKAIAFDKTGTLTYGKPEVTNVKALKKETDLLHVAASIEAGSEHPLAEAILSYSKAKDIKPSTVKKFESITGKGVKATLDDETVAIGNRTMMQDFNINTSSIEAAVVALEEEGKTVVMVSKGSTLLGYLAIADQIKEEAPAVLKTLHDHGIATVMLTGDNERTAKAIAQKAGIKDVVAGVLPDGKVDEVKRLQETYGLVAMVGDGINDAPALTQADVGMAIGSGTDVAIEAADVTLIRGDLEAVFGAYILSKGIFRKIKQNYFWAWFYNAVAIPFAMLGLLHPMIGAAAMSVSSLNVVYNSLRLKKLPLKGVNARVA